MLMVDKEHPIGLNIQVATILPVYELNTSQSKQLAFANEPPQFMNISSVVFILENPEETKVDPADGYAKQLVSELKKIQKLNLIYDGNRSTNGLIYRSNLNEEFLLEDAVGLAMMVYEEATREGNF